MTALAGPLLMTSWMELVRHSKAKSSTFQSFDEAPDRVWEMLARLQQREVSWTLASYDVRQPFERA
jgi:hypothetical protein